MKNFDGFIWNFLIWNFAKKEISMLRNKKNESLLKMNIES